MVETSKAHETRFSTRTSLRRTPPLLGDDRQVLQRPGAPTTFGVQDGRITRRVPSRLPAQAAGEVVLGKTNLPLMLADMQSYNAVYGTTNNPWDLARTPGGSSGGSAAALAAGYVPLELGSDLGGSLRVPASFCGVFAHKPTPGIVPMRGRHLGSPSLRSRPGRPRVAGR